MTGRKLRHLLTKCRSEELVIPEPEPAPWIDPDDHTCFDAYDAQGAVSATPAIPTCEFALLPGQVIPTPSHFLDRISPIFPPLFLVFCAFLPPRRDGSNEPQARTQGRETAGTCVQTAGNTVSAVGLTPGVRNA